MKVSEYLFTARFARGSEGAENNKLSIAFEMTATEKDSVSLKVGQ
jgi:hypothetical protein